MNCTDLFNKVQNKMGGRSNASNLNKTHWVIPIGGGETVEYYERRVFGYALKYRFGEHIICPLKDGKEVPDSISNQILGKVNQASRLRKAQLQQCAIDTVNGKGFPGINQEGRRLFFLQKRRAGLEWHCDWAQANGLMSKAIAKDNQV